MYVTVNVYNSDIIRVYNTRRIQMRLNLIYKSITLLIRHNTISRHDVHYAVPNCGRKIYIFCDIDDIV